jgi:hypothetical protein
MREWRILRHLHQLNANNKVPVGQSGQPFSVRRGSCTHEPTAQTTWTETDTAKLMDWTTRRNPMDWPECITRSAPGDL